MMKHWIRFFCLSLLSIVAGMASAQNAEVIEISTVQGLKDFRDAVNKGDTYAGKTVKLTLDLDLSGESNWTPIGNVNAYPSNSFNGTFDGDGHAISNVTSSDYTPGETVAGLFGSVVNGTIKNLTVKNVNVSSSHYAAGIVCYTSDAPTIENCHVIGGTIKSVPGESDGGNKVGGIMGLAQAGSTINNCTVEGVTISGYREVGGIVGYSNGTVTNNTAINVTVKQDLTHDYKPTTPTSIGDIIGEAGSSATLSNNKVIKSIVKVTDNEGKEAEYGDMKDAFDAINANPKESYTITLLKDATYTDAEQYRHAALAKDNTVTKNVIIDGAGHTLTFVGGGVRGFYTESTAAEKVTFQNMTIADNTRYDAENGNNAWEFAYLEMGEANTCPLEFTNVKFADGISVDGTKTTFTDCEFIADGNAKRSTQTAENCIWISNGEVIVNNCTFTGYRAIKLHEAYGTEIGSVVIDGCTFKDLSVKPAVVIGDLNAATSVTITNNTIEGVQKGDQEMYLYESDTDLANFTNNLSGNTFNAKNEAELTVALNSGMFNKAVLQDDIALTENVTCGLEEGKFTLVQGEKTLASEGHTIALNPDVTIVTDKQTDIFSAADPNFKVIETAVDGGYTYTVAAKEYVAQIGEGENAVKYESLEEALAAISTVTTAKHDKSGLTINQYKANGTVSLLADCEGNGIVINSESNLTIDFAGHTYSVTGDLVGSNGTESQGFQLLKNSNVTFKSTAAEPGLITSAKATFLVQNYSNLTLENMNLDGSNLNGSGTYTLSNNNGNVVINNSSITAKEGTGNFAFDVCRYASYPSVNVTVKGESVINGNVEVSASGSDAKDGFKLMLEAGTLNGNIVLDASAKTAMAAAPEKATVSKSNTLTAIAAPDGYKWVDNGDGTSSLVLKTYVAQIGDVKYETLKEALDAAKDNENIVVELLADATLDVAAWSGETNKFSIGSVNTKSITINGNSHQLTFNQTNSDWNCVATMNDAETKLILNDMAITNSGHNDGPWNRHDINFSCAVELKNVTSDKALAFKNDASLNNVTVTETGDVYAIWVQPHGQNISIDGLTINAANGRGIKIDDQYVDNPEQVTLDIANATFNTKNKSAILVKSAANTVITAGEGINIANVAADKDNLVWVDEDRAEEFYKVTVNNAKIMPEPRETDYVACLLNGEKRWGYYKNLSKAIDNVDEGYSIRLHQTTDEAVVVSKLLTITKNGFTADNVTAGEGYKRFESETEIVIRSFNPICAIGDNKYETLAEAVAAAGTSEATITLLTEAATDGVISGAGVVVPSGSNITFDLNGLTYEVNGKTVGSTGTETQGFQLLQGSNITFKNGTLKATSPSAQMVIQNYSNLTLENVNIDGTGLSGWAYALSNNCGTINLTGSTSITAKEGGRAFDTCKFGSYAIPTVNINTTGTITGPIEVTGGKLNIENGKFDVTWVTDSHYAAGDIQIKGGVFTAEVSADYCAEGFVCTDNDDEKYMFTVKSNEEAGIFVLYDKEPYKYVDEMPASEVTYVRSFGTKNVQSWYVPFEYTVTEDDAKNFSFYKIHMIAASGNEHGGNVSDNTKVYIYIEPLEAGFVMKANRPYVIKAKNPVQNYNFIAKDIDKLYKPDDTSRLHNETTEFTYDFFGTYGIVYCDDALHWIAISGGLACPLKENAKVQQYRWYIKISPKSYHDDYAKLNFIFVEGDGETDGISAQTIDGEIEGIYTLGGMKVEHPVKGVNIIKYTDGRTKKINVK